MTRKVSRTEYGKACDALEQWDDEDRRNFAIWMSVYAPEAVMRFELSRRRLRTLTSGEDAR